MNIISPHEGPQTAFLSSEADICIYGGAAGGGKTWALLLEPLRHINNGRFRCVFFRRKMTEVTEEGGPWDKSADVYPYANGRQHPGGVLWTFPSGATIRFAHMIFERSRFDWKGAEVDLMIFDQLETFTSKQFWYLLSRSRTTSGIIPYIRGSCNPPEEENSWLKEFLAPWVDPEHPEYPFPAGVLRYFTRIDNNLVWVEKDWTDELGVGPLSVTFIPAKVTDNPSLMEADPLYMSKLRALSEVDRRRLLDGDWTVLNEGNFFRREWFNRIEDVNNIPWERLLLCRYWDLGSTEKYSDMDDPDFSAGALVGLDVKNGQWYLIDMAHFQLSPSKIDDLMEITAWGDALLYTEMLRRVGISDKDGRPDARSVIQVVEQEPGSSGKRTVDYMVRYVLRSFPVKGDHPTGAKEMRARIVAAKAEHGALTLVMGAHNIVKDLALTHTEEGDSRFRLLERLERKYSAWRRFIAEAVSFPSKEAHDDQIDAVSGAMNWLAHPTKGGKQPLPPGAPIMRRGEPQEERPLNAPGDDLHQLSDRLARTGDPRPPGNRKRRPTFGRGGRGV